MFERYTERARRVLFFARYEASQLGVPSIETEHLLLGLLREGKGVTSREFARAHLSMESVHADIERRRTGRREPIPTSVEIPFSAESKRVLYAAAEESDRLLHSYIGTEHLLLGLLRERGCVAASILSAHGLELARVREDIVALLHERDASRHPDEPRAADVPRDHRPGPAVPVPDFVPSGTVHIMRSQREPWMRTTPREWVALGSPLSRAVAAAWGVDERHVDVVSPVADARLDIVLMLPHDESRASIETRVRQAIEDQLAVVVGRESHATDVFVATAPGGAGAALRQRAEPAGIGAATAYLSFSTAAPPQRGAPMFPIDRLSLSEAAMPMLCATLEEVLGLPVIDRTGLQGVFDLELTRPIADREALLAALREEAGLRLTRERGHIDRLVVRPR